MRLLRPAVVVALSLAAALCGATAAKADGPVITPVSRIVTTPIPFGASCGSFSILFTANVEGTNISFYDDNNRLVRQIRHVSFTGTLYNSSDLSKTVPYEGHFTRTFDAAAQTITLTGLNFLVMMPGQGVVAIRVGETVLDSLTGQVVSENGQGFAGFTADVCSALS
jgi:hypothetical protein